MLMRKEKERRFKKLGQTNATLSSKTQMLGLGGGHHAKQKQDKKTFTGKAVINDDLNKMIDEIEDLTKEEITVHLKRAKIIKTKDKKWAWHPIPFTVESMNSVYIFDRNSAFRRVCFNL